MLQLFGTFYQLSQTFYFNCLPGYRKIANLSSSGCRTQHFQSKPWFMHRFSDQGQADTPEYMQQIYE
jgi:hypothetical protein